MFVNGASHLHQIEASDEELARAASRCEQMFPVPLRLYNAIIAKLIESPEYNLAKRANLFWDLQLAFTVSPSLRAFDAPVWLVTSDVAILDAAREAEAGHFVRSLDEYRSVVTGGVDSLLSALTTPGAPA
jgi:hypothetical protein